MHFVHRVDIRSNFCIFFLLQALKEPWKLSTSQVSTAVCNEILNEAWWSIVCIWLLDFQNQPTPGSQFVDEGGDKKEELGIEKNEGALGGGGGGIKNLKKGADILSRDRLFVSI